MPVMKSGGRFGDMIIHSNVEVPVKLTKRQKELVAELDSELSAASSPESESFFGKVKAFFDSTKN